MIEHVLQSFVYTSRARQETGLGLSVQNVPDMFASRRCEECDNEPKLVSREPELRSTASLPTAFERARIDVNVSALCSVREESVMSHVDSAGVL